MLAVMVKASDVGQREDALAARLEAIAGVPVEVKAWSDADVNLMAQGGGRVIGFDARSSTRRSAQRLRRHRRQPDRHRTAAHCPDQISYVERVRGVPLTMVGAWALLSGRADHVGAGVLTPYSMPASMLIGQDVSRQ